MMTDYEVQMLKLKILEVTQRQVQIAISAQGSSRQTQITVNECDEILEAAIKGTELIIERHQCQK